LARRVVEARDRHVWLDDAMDFDARFEPHFSDVEVAEARKIRQTLGADIAYAADALPDPDALPDVARVVAAHGELARDKELDDKARSGGVPYMARVAVEQARSVHAWLRNLHAF